MPIKAKNKLGEEMFLVHCDIFLVAVQGGLPDCAAVTQRNVVVTV